MRKPKKRELTIMVSSTVYGIEDWLEQVYGILTTLGYKVWMSHMGTVPIVPGKSAYDMCLQAVEDCDIFFGLITPQYGSGLVPPTNLSITHLELRKAIELDKPRWLLAHRTVVTARRLFMDVGFVGTKGRSKLKLRKGASLIDNLGVIDMYEDGIRDALAIGERVDNWVQQYSSRDDVFRYVSEQFDRYEQLHAFINEQKRAKECVS